MDLPTVKELSLITAVACGVPAVAAILAHVFHLVP